MNSERRDYLAAFALGAIVGAGIAVLLTPAPRGKRRKHQLEPAVQRFRKRRGRLRRLRARH